MIIYVYLISSRNSVKMRYHSIANCSAHS